VPPFALRLAVGEFAAQLLASEKVVPQVALDSGYRFQWPELEPALKNCLQ
jgi:NAD dependent epimerase/dehydratase family enzyme